jgi:lipoprotein-anchoring transpeptidase ErfK/SrfK
VFLVFVFEQVDGVGAFGCDLTWNGDGDHGYSVWLPYASYFNGGIAFHESRDVPAYPASHGCVRVPRDDAPLVYTFAALHLPVRVLR